MPEVVFKYLDAQDFKLAGLTQSNIIADYLDDMSKYNTHKYAGKKPKPLY